MKSNEDITFFIKSSSTFISSLTDKNKEDNLATALGLIGVFAFELNLTTSELKGFLEDILKCYKIHIDG